MPVGIFPRRGDFLEYLISEENQKRIDGFFPIAEERFSAALQKRLGEGLLSAAVIVVVFIIAVLDEDVKFL